MSHRKRERLEADLADLDVERAQIVSELERVRTCLNSGPLKPDAPAGRLDESEYATYSGARAGGELLYYEHFANRGVHWLLVWVSVVCLEVGLLWLLLRVAARFYRALKHRKKGTFGTVVK